LYVVLAISVNVDGRSGDDESVDLGCCPRRILRVSGASRCDGHGLLTSLVVGLAGRGRAAATGVRADGAPRPACIFCGRIGQMNDEARRMGLRLARASRAASLGHAVECGSFPRRCPYRRFARSSNVDHQRPVGLAARLTRTGPGVCGGRTGMAGHRSADGSHEGDGGSAGRRAGSSRECAPATRLAALAPAGAVAQHRPAGHRGSAGGQASFRFRVSSR